MTAINDANRLYKGASVVANAYVGTTMVWPRISTAYAVFDAATAQAVLLTGGGLSVKNTGSGTTPSGARVADASGKSAGKFYYETTMTSWATGGVVGFIGVGTISSNFATMQNNATTGTMLYSNGQIWSVGGIPGSLGSLTSGARIGAAVDLDNDKIWFRILPAGQWDNNGSHDPTTNVGGFSLPSGTLVPFVTFGGVSTGPGNIVKANLGHYTFVTAAPAGFTSGWTV